MSDHADDLRVSGMRDLGPEVMRAFRGVERVFLDVTGRAGFAEVRTPTVEPLHLYTSSGALSPQLLDRVYSFLDWDGWSGERVVLRPDATVAAARWYLEGRDAVQVARLCYVQPVFRFEPGDADREVWQCGVESFGVGAPEGDVELVRLGLRFLQALGIEGLEVELAHAGLVRAALEAAGLDRGAQIEAYDRLLAGDTAVADDLLERYPQGSSALRLLFAVNGDTLGYLANLRATLAVAVPAVASALAELEAVAAALDEAGVAYRVQPGTARNLEYYSGVTFRIIVQGRECLTGGRYDDLCEAISGEGAPASGFGADLLGLIELLPARRTRRSQGHPQ
ncbi:MAG: ATP phosphoribosyltransferase regulatory subunit [Dehalococcoidia bacterium]|nr:ATP phosphoribosyltransferase regulatory subunit [Dehalococcoidia bacterium]